LIEDLIFRRAMLIYVDILFSIAAGFIAVFK